MQTLRGRGIGAAWIVSTRPDQNWQYNLSLCELSVSATERPKSAHT